jgi:predicted nucleotidyltransferase
MPDKLTVSRANQAAVLGVITEFNPLHRGHLYALAVLQEKTQPEITVCAMSGNFTQRGEPAICGKFARARMALECGVDIVIELPLLFAVRSAYYFARAGVSLLRDIGCTHLGLGAEDADLELLGSIAALLREEPPDFKLLLRQQLASGSSYAASRARAVSALLPEAAAAFSRPNNILAVEYLRCLAELNPALTPVIIPRRGADYNELRLEPGVLPSARALRAALLNGDPGEKIAPALPEAAANLLQAEISAGRAPVSPERLFPLLLYRLRSISAAELKALAGVEEGLENRLLQAAAQVNYADFITAVKTRRYPLTRLQRLLAAIVLGMEKTAVRRADLSGNTYFSVLAANRRGLVWLKERRSWLPAPLILRGRDLRWLRETSNPVLEADLRASALYALLYPHAEAHSGKDDFLQPRYWC